MTTIGNAENTFLEVWNWYGWRVATVYVFQTRSINEGGVSQKFNDILWEG
jgi:hypothetical protein